MNCSPQTVRTGSSYYGDKVEYLELWQDDLPDYCVMQDFNTVWEFATAGPCFLHCEQGVNRSGCLVVAMHMRLKSAENGCISPEEALMSSWRFVAERKGRVVTNPGFQLQLLLFARLGLQWFPSVQKLWMTSKERNMSEFREMAEIVARRVVGANVKVPPEQKLRVLVSVRDGAVRGEMHMKEGFDLDSEDACRRSERRVQAYATKILMRFTTDLGTPPTSKGYAVMR